ncbi:MAG TPA: IS200/IS605 family transposase [Armatimonadota bacterium]
MPQSLVEIYVHLVWTTHNREPLLISDTERSVYRVLASEAAKMNCRILALGGVADHVHVLVSLPAQYGIPRLLNQMKGASSHLIRATPSGEGFGWQGGYAALSVSPNHVPRVQAYVQRQKAHHAECSTFPAWEPSLEQNAPSKAE